MILFVGAICSHQSAIIIMQSIDDLVQSYLSNTQFYGLIRNRLKTMLS